MRQFLVTSTRKSAETAIQEILKADPVAIVNYRHDNKTVLRVFSEILDEDKIESFPGVACAVDTAAIDLVKATL